MENIISVKNIKFEYINDDNTLTVLKDFSVDFQKGSFTAVLGHNGSGKSTLAKLLNREFEIEHTIPRSISFDDSLANKTICNAAFNAYKNNRFPSELPEYETILSRIQPWKDKIKNLESQIVNLRNKCKMAPKVTSKDSSTTKIKTKINPTSSAEAPSCLLSIRTRP